ncbi:M23 family metallopeptidase [Segatella buccae]|uniref:M23 family metallopeptidase n=1 Tax=Segatella buccae TaxID=28126 RepID=UPI0028F04DC1|nr:M23 family metallopeptidase [Segatella buccae]
MNLRKYLKKVSIVSLFALTAMPVAGQDLLARQAPVDRRMKAVDTIVLKQTIIKENTESPAAQLYDDWSNRYAHRATQVPDSFRIDLRHFCMPTPSRVVTSNFGSRWGRQHKGLDIKVYIGDTIRAAFSGKVRVVKYEGGGYGKYIVIRHNNGLETIYGHLSKQLVAEDQTVRAGEPIGLGGNTGRSTGSHLHFETRLCGVALNPALMFDFRNQDVVSDFYVYIKSNYEHESAEATRLRGKVGNGGYNRDEVQGELANNSNANFDSSADMRYHKVKSGETLASIAEKRGVTIDTICKLNHITKGKAVRPGQILRYS